MTLIDSLDTLVVSILFFVFLDILLFCCSFVKHVQATVESGEKGSCQCLKIKNESVGFFALLLIVKFPIVYPVFIVMCDFSLPAFE